jgi:hypothetical protein
MPAVQAPQYFNFSSPQSVDKLLQAMPHLAKVYALQAEDGDIPPVDPPLHFDKTISISDGPGLMTIINLTLIIMLILAVIVLYVACKWQHRRLGDLTIKAAGYVTWPVQNPAPNNAQPAIGPPRQAPSTAQPAIGPPRQAPIASQAPTPRVSLWPTLPLATEVSSEQQQDLNPAV